MAAGTDRQEGTDVRRTGSVALVPARNRADSVGPTVQALRRIGGLDRIVVIDDGSTDATTDRARAAGAEVLRLPTNRGKGGAVAAGVEVCPDAEVFLLVDADVGSSAGQAGRLLAPVADGEADVVVGVLPAAGRRGGLGSVRRVAGAGIARACGLRTRAPLSGQRAVRAHHLRELRSAERFGLEVAMTIDAVRSGARLREVEVTMGHRPAGRSLQGWLHRGRQGLDVLAALWCRLTSARARIAGIVATTLVLLGALVWSGSSQVSASVAGGGDAEQVVLVGVPHLALDDLDSGTLPTLDRLAGDGALAATNVRTRSTRPSTAEAYATIGAGTRVAAGPGAARAFPADAPVEGGTAAEVASRRTTPAPDGEVLVPSMPAVVDGAGEHLSSAPGALGQRLAEAGMTTAVVSNADTVALDGERVAHRPAAVSVADRAGSVGTGSVGHDRLLRSDPAEPYGRRADVGSFLEETTAALDRADMVTVDLGDTDRAASYAGFSSPEAAAAARERALERVDLYLERLVPTLDRDTLLLVVGVTPPTGEWELTPTVAHGAGVVPGSLHSTVTKREGLITLTDLTPTILDWFDLDTPSGVAGMIGRSLRFRPEPPDVAGLQQLNEHAGSREQAYYPMAVTFIAVQALVYLLAAVVFSQRATHRVGRALRLVVLAFAAWPVATFVERGIPGIEEVGALRQGIVWLLAGAIAVVAARARRRPLAPLAWIAGATVAVLVVDVATGANLQMASILGYSPHTAARYVGFGNTAFAVLAACAVLVAAVHVAHAPRRSEAVITAGGLLAVVLVADMWPTLGADVGGVLTMVPVFGLLVVALSGRRLSWRPVLALGGATVAVLAAVTAVDLLQSEDARSHLGRYVAGAAGEDGDFWTTIERKWSTNMRVFGSTIWTWMVPITAAFMLYMLVIARGWQRLLPAGSSLRTGVVAMLCAGTVGWLVNDSGVVVSALVLVFVGPYLTLLALDRERGPPVLLPPAPGGVPVAQLAGSDPPPG